MGIKAKKRKATTQTARRSLHQLRERRHIGQCWEKGQGKWRKLGQGQGEGARRAELVEVSSEVTPEDRHARVKWLNSKQRARG